MKKMKEEHKCSKEKETQLQQEKLSLEEKKKQIDIKTAKLEQMAAIVNKKYQDADDLIAVND